MDDEKYDDGQSAEHASVDDEITAHAAEPPVPAEPMSATYFQEVLCDVSILWCSLS